MRRASLGVWLPLAVALSGAGCATDDPAQNGPGVGREAALVDGRPISKAAVEQRARQLAAREGLAGPPLVEHRARALRELIEGRLLPPAERGPAATVITDEELTAAFGGPSDPGAKRPPSASPTAPSAAAERLIYVASFDDEPAAATFAEQARADAQRFRPPSAFGVPVRPRSIRRGQGPGWVVEPVFSARSGTVIGPLPVTGQQRVLLVVEEPDEPAPRGVAPPAARLARRRWASLARRAPALQKRWAEAEVEIRDEAIAAWLSPGSPEVARARRCLAADPAHCREPSGQADAPPDASRALDVADVRTACERTAAPSLCARFLRAARGPGEGGLFAAAALGLCLAPDAAISDAERATGCEALAALDGADRVFAVDRACQAGSGRACEVAARLALDRGAMAEGLEHLRRARRAGELAPGEVSLLDELRAREEACEAGDVPACTSLAEDYWALTERAALGQSPEAATVERLRAYLRRACEAGSRPACGHLGQLHVEGRGLSIDLEAAERALRQACEPRSLPGCEPLADVERARECRQPADEACVVKAGFLLGPRATAEDRARGLGLLEEGCESGGEVACDHLVDRLYRRPESAPGLPSDVERALALCQEARAQHGGLPSCVPLERLREEREACRADNATACAEAATLTLQAADLSAADRRAALDHRRRACRLGHAPSCEALVVGEDRLFDVGHGLEQLCRRGGPSRAQACATWGRWLREARSGRPDPEAARAAFEDACGKGDVDSCARLGSMLFTGEAGVYEPDRGRRLLDAACERGSAYGCAFPR